MKPSTRIGEIMLTRPDEKWMLWHKDKEVVRVAQILDGLIAYLDEVCALEERRLTLLPCEACKSGGQGLHNGCGLDIPYTSKPEETEEKCTEQQPHSHFEKGKFSIHGLETEEKEEIAKCPLCRKVLGLIEEHGIGICHPTNVRDFVMPEEKEPNLYCFNCKTVHELRDCTKERETSKCCEKCLVAGIKGTIRECVRTDCPCHKESETQEEELVGIELAVNMVVEDGKAIVGRTTKSRLLKALKSLNN